MSHQVPLISPITIFHIHPFLYIFKATTLSQGFHLLPPRPLEQPLVGSPWVYPPVCSQRELSKVKWVHVLFFFKSLQVFPLPVILGVAFKGLHILALSHLFGFIIITLLLRTLCLQHQNFHCALNSSVPLHLWFFAYAVSSAWNDILYLLRLENSIDGGGDTQEEW